MAKGYLFQNGHQNELLWNAVKAQQLDAAKAALSAGADPNTFRVPSVLRDDKGNKNTSVEFRTMTEDNVEHHNQHDNGRIRAHDLHKHEEYVSVMMVAAQNKDIPMLNALLEAGGNVNLVQPALTFADGYGYGGMRPICYALHCSKTTQWFVDHHADVDIRIRGLPGYEDIPCPNYHLLLLASQLYENDKVARILVEACEHGSVNFAAQRNTGGQGADTRVDSYWRTAVKAGDVAWAKRLIDAYGADPNWPSAALIRGTDISYPSEHDGFRETVLIAAVANHDVPMVAMLLASGADASVCENINLYKDEGKEVLWTEEDPEVEMADGVKLPGGFTKKVQFATPLSIALGNAAVPKKALVVDDTGLITDVLPPFHADPMIALLLGEGAECHETATRVMVK